MNITELLVKEMKEEAVTTRKMLERIPADKLGWQPHPKSMTMKQLSTHLAELPSWVSMTLNTDGLDFATAPYEPAQVNDSNDLLAIFDKSLKDGLTALEKAAEADFLPGWTLRTGDHIHSISTKYEVVRMSFSQIVHHRAQLGVFLRLLDIPIPGSYGPSADDTKF
jgi:uncharacterized damage-inducible protein DinB